MRAPPRAHDLLDRFLELLRARTSSSTLSASSRPPASSTDGQSIVNALAIIGAVIVRAVVLLNIAVAGAFVIVVADVVDVISSSHTSEYGRHVHVHH